MRLPGLRNLLPALFALTLPFLAAAQTHVQANRIAARPDFSTRTPLTGHVPAWTSSALDQGAVPASTPISLTFSLSRSPRLQAAFDQLLLDQQNPSSPRFHQWLTPQQVGEQYGPTQDDLDAVTGWLTAQGLHLDSVAPSRIFLHATAPASTVNAVFETSLHTFSHNSRSLMEPTSEPVIPAALAPIVTFIQGLAEVDYHTFGTVLPAIPIAQTNIRPADSSPSTTVPATPDATFGSDGSVHWISPADFAILYNVPTDVTGASQWVAVIGGSRLSATDVTGWESFVGLPSYQPNYIIPPDSACPSNGLADPAKTSSCSDPGTTMTDRDQGEGTLDFERVYGTAPGVSVDQIISTNWLNGTVTYELISYAIQQNADSILTMSFGACEAKQSTSFLNYENSLFSQAASQGISVFASSGDSGAAGCEAPNASPPATQSAAISDICSSQYVTCVGGTQFSDTVSPSTYWASKNSSVVESALSYIPEGAWNEPLNTNGSGVTVTQASATGGGVSVYTAKPSFQIGKGVPADGARDVPDISFSASGHNAYILCLSYGGSDCKATVSGFGGTSASAPSMAGVAALLNQKLSGRQGNLNPLLYRLYASAPAAFHDATPATSGVTSCTTSTPSTCNNSTPSQTGLSGGLAGYPLTAGYDLATGLGSLDVNAFLNAATTPSLATTTTTLTANPTTITTAQTVVFTAAVAATTGTPTGTVAFTSNGTSLGSPIALASGKAVTSSVPFTTAGTYTIVASYSGDSVYGASTSTLSFVVTAPVLPTTTTTLMGTASSITTQQMVSYTASITSTATGTPTGTVQFVRTSSGTATNLGAPVALAGGKAASPSFSLPAGAYTISGIYSGDSGFTGSTSAGVGLTVTAVATTTISLPITTTVTAIQSTTFTATIAPSGSGTPTGTVQFLVDFVARGSAVALSGATATSAGLTLTVGTHAVSAIYSGDAVFASSTSGFDAVTSTLAPTTVAFTTAPTSTSQFATTTFVASVSGLSSAVATTGSVTFKDATTGATLTNPTIVYSGTTATATLNTTFTSTGNHVLSAQFNGDTTTYAASPVVTTTVTVTSAPTYILTPASPTLTLTSASAQTGTDVVTAASTTGYTGSISFACTVALTGGGTPSVAPTCALSPTSIPFPASSSTTVTLGTIAPRAVDRGQVSSLRPGVLAVGGTLTFAGLFLFGLPLPRRRTSWRAVTTLLLLAGSLVGLSACGSAVGVSIPHTPTGGTTAGAYTVTITGTTSTGIPATSTTIALTVN